MHELNLCGMFDRDRTSPATSMFFRPNKHRRAEPEGVVARDAQSRGVVANQAKPDGAGAQAEAPAGALTQEADMPAAASAELDELERKQLLDHWRRCEQRVMRAWNAWQAADRRDDGLRYRTFMSTLAEEERAAAEIERRAVSSPD
jgi:PAS domain-containing protein